MSQASRLFTVLTSIALATACGDKAMVTPEADTGVAPGDDAGGGHPDAVDGVDAAPDAGVEDTGGGSPDALPTDVEPSPAVAVSGKVVKLGQYLAGTNAYVGQGTVLALGVVPQQSTLTSADMATLGEYSLTLPSNGQVYLFTNKVGYNPTYNKITTEAADVTGKNIYLAEVAWLNEIAAAHNVDLGADFACHAAPDGSLDPAQRCIYGVVVGRILDDGTAGNGTRRPVGGVAKTDFAITYGAMSTPWYKKGPYFLDYTGTSSVTATGSVVYNDGMGNYKGGLFIFFAELPKQDGPESRDLNVSITYNYMGNPRYFGPLVVKAFRPYGVSWVNVYETGTAPPPPPPGDIDFDTQIYPLFLPVTAGGFGCQGCHTNKDGAVPTGGMNLYGGPEVAFNSLNPATYPQRVNLTTPADSLVLKKPLYEPLGVQDHPIFAFASEADPGYQLIYQWIVQGATRPLVPPPPISFLNEVRPLLYNDTLTGGAGCISCHGDRGNEAGRTFYMGGNAQQLYDELVNTAPADNGATGEPYRINKQGSPEVSLLLINPLSGNPEPHPVKIFSDNADPRYQLLYRWIAEGWQNN